MAKITFDQIGNYTRGGGKYFSIKPGESARVRFLYNTTNDIVPYVVHEFNTPGNSVTIDCGRQNNEPLDACKWCASGNPAVVRVVIPLYNEGTGEIEYWKKTGTWVQNTLQPLAQQLQQGQPISGQVFIIGRTGEGLQTRYSVMPDMSRPNDGRKADEFGEIQDAYTTGMIKEADYDYDPNAVPQQNNFGQPQQGFNQQPQQGFNQQFNQGYNQQSFGGQQATRRVVDSF